ncbi:MAG: hypothetical protein II846_02320 [Acetobacter sp.]|nr:hypothetical protein [Acetobacter sp.]
MERREKIQGFIKKYIILKKRKPTDSIFAEKRSAVAITFALMLPVFFGMFCVAVDGAYLYCGEEMLSMASDAQSTFFSATSAYDLMWGPFGGYANTEMARLVLADVFCQAPASSGGRCPANQDDPFFYPTQVALTTFSFNDFNNGSMTLSNMGYVNSGLFGSSYFGMTPFSWSTLVYRVYATSVATFVRSGPV